MSNGQGPNGRHLSPSMIKKMQGATSRHGQRQNLAKAEAAKMLERMTPLERDAEIQRITKAIMENLGGCDLEAGLTVLCGIGGQLVARLAGGNLSTVKTMALGLSENICKAGYAKLIHEQGLKNNKDGK